jgi:hypothetical protein
MWVTPDKSDNRTSQKFHLSGLRVNQELTCKGVLSLKELNLVLPIRR